jgi:hypothetical protein
VDLIEKTATEYFSGIQAAGGDVSALIERGPDAFFEAARELDPKLPPVDSKSKVASAIFMEVARSAQA